MDPAKASYSRVGINTKMLKDTFFDRERIFLSCIGGRLAASCRPSQMFIISSSGNSEQFKPTQRNLLRNPAIMQVRTTAVNIFIIGIGTMGLWQSVAAGGGGGGVGGGGWLLVSRDRHFKLGTFASLSGCWAARLLLLR